MFKLFDLFPLQSTPSQTLDHVVECLYRASGWTAMLSISDASMTFGNVFVILQRSRK